MALQPISSSGSTRGISVNAFSGPNGSSILKTVKDVFDWLRSMADTPQDKAALAAEEAAFVRAYGNSLPGSGVSVNQLVAWALYGESPFGDVGPQTPPGRSLAKMKQILVAHLKNKKNETLDRIIYLLRVVFHDRVDMKGRPKAPVEPEKRDVRSYHAGYNDRTAYRIEHNQKYN